MMDENVLVKVEGVSKKYSKDLKTSLWYGIKDVLYNIINKKSDKIELRSKEFWALQNINFELKRGECIGLIGHNGAGKSTLLKILNGLINPDTGQVIIKGRVSALIELGAGFNPILSGRENIYNNGAILGFKRQEIDDKLDAIISFSELEEFIDMPVQNYSSGMKVRLGFAVAAQMEPDVLLIDEVLAVGDLGFVLKCLKTIDEILPKTAIIFVSHSMPMVSRICNKILLLDKGVTKFQGYNVGKAIDLYYERFINNRSNIIFDEGSIELKEAKIINHSNQESIGNPQLHWNDHLRMKFCFETIKNVNKVPIIDIIIFDKEQRPVAILENNKYNTELIIKNNTIKFTLIHNNLQLSKGLYSINISVIDASNNRPMLRINNLLNFQIIHDDDVWQPFLLKAKYENFNE